MPTICMVVLCIGASRDFMADPEANARVGNELRRIREQAGLSGSAVARELGWSQSKVSRVETGRFGASIGEVAALLDYYAVAEEVRAEILQLGGTGRRGPGGLGGSCRWTTAPPRRGRSGRGSGEALMQYQALWFPGLLQAPSYANAIAKAGHFPAPEEIAARRQERQEALRSRHKVAYQVVVEQGSPGAQSGQPRDLARAADGSSRCRQRRIRRSSYPDRAG